MEIHEIIARMKSGYNLRYGIYGWFLTPQMTPYKRDERMEIEIEIEIINAMKVKGLITTKIPYVRVIAELTAKGEQWQRKPE